MYSITALRRITHTTSPFFFNLSFEQLAETLTKPRAGEKTPTHCTIPAWSPATFKGGLRSKNVTHLSCMVYDIDDGLLFDEHNKFKNWQYIAYTSPSHSILHHKWRLVIPFDEPVPAKYWPWVWKFMVRQFQKYTNSLLNGGNIDPSCKDPRRFYFFGKDTPVFDSYVHDTGYNYWVNIDMIREMKREEEEELERFQQEQRKKLKKMENRPIRNRDAFQELRMNLSISPTYRQTLADRIGATITGGANPRAVRWDCPQCGRNDCTFFYIHPKSNCLGAFCNHKNSCGMSVSLFELGRAKGVF